MKIIRTAAIVGLTVAATVIAPLTASANDTSKGLYTTDSAHSRLGYGGVTNSHTRFYSCDTLADGDGFRTQVKLKNGSTDYVDDANGSKSGCSDIDNAGTSRNPIVKFRVISKQAGGTDNWIYSDWITA